MKARTYWLRLVEDAELVASGGINALVREADELVAIQTASIKTAKQREARSCGEAQYGKQRLAGWGAGNQRAE